MIDAKTAKMLSCGEGVVLPIKDQIGMLAYSGLRELTFNKKECCRLAIAVLRIQLRKNGYTITEDSNSIKISW